MANDNNIQPMADDSQIVLYQPDESISLQVKIEEDTVWLTQAQMVELFGSSKANISEHITNIYQQGELVQSATVRKFRTVRKEGNRMVTRNMDYYNLDMIISVGFRVNSHQGIRFRQWANNVLKEYLLRGYAVHQQMLQMEQRIDSKLMFQHDEMQRIKDHLRLLRRLLHGPGHGSGRHVLLRALPQGPEQGRHRRQSRAGGPCARRQHGRGRDEQPAQHAALLRRWCRFGARLFLSGHRPAQRQGRPQRRPFLPDRQSGGPLQDHRRDRHRALPGRRHGLRGRPAADLRRHALGRGPGPALLHAHRPGASGRGHAPQSRGR